MWLNPAQQIAQDQKQDQAHGQAHAHHQGIDGTLLWPAVMHQKEHGEAQRRDDGDQGQSDDDIHGHAQLKFRPPVWAVLLTLSAVLLFATLSHWQYQRGQQKADIIAARAAAARSVPLRVRSGAALPEHGRRIHLQGYWQSEQQVLLDNQTRGRLVGVQVWTPLRLQGSEFRVLVNRGWLRTSAYRDVLPDTGDLPDGLVEVSGFWRDLPRAGLNAAAGACEAGRRWPQRLNYPQIEQLRCLYGASLANGLLLLDPQASHGFVREWTDLGIKPVRHYGYAIQWGALLLTALILFVVLNLKRTP